MTTRLSQPVLITPSELKANSALSTSITKLVNDSFYRSKESDPTKWSNVTLRFQSEDALHIMLIDEGSVMALIFDEKDENLEATTSVMNGNETNGDASSCQKLVACAAAVHWKGGWEQEGASTETGWEFKTVCVDSDPKYHHRGLAVRLLTFLEEYLIENTKIQLRGEGKKEGEGALALWILAADCINGVYWRKRGYQEVRRKAEGAGVWSCRTSFDMLVLRKTVPIQN
jgi:GNAT superfamily N-acetyltransferase